MIEYFLPLLGIPLGIIASRVMKDEKDIWSKAPYFPVFAWVLAVLTAVFLTLDKTAGLSFGFMLILVLIWKNF